MIMNGMRVHAGPRYAHHLPAAAARDSASHPAVSVAQRRMQSLAQASRARGPARSGSLPEPLKSGIESLSGRRFDHVRVHYDSPEPRALQADAFARGSEIHLGPGQTRHLAHEAWHLVQQSQGRVPARAQLRGTSVNDDAGLEREADRMGALALEGTARLGGPSLAPTSAASSDVAQCKTTIGYANPQNFDFNQSSGLVGSAMKAHLDPDDPAVGSDTNASVAFADLFRDLQTNTPTTWVRGHLLNHDLGGIAHINNLFPITTAANNEHKYEVEYPIKHWLNEDCEIDYQVIAAKDNAGDKTSADGTFTCTAKATSGKYLNEEINKVIHSRSKAVDWTRERKGGVKKDVKNSHASVDYGPNTKVFRDSYKAPKPRPKWAHRSGATGDNYALIDDMRHDMLPEQVLTVLKLEQDARTVLMDFYQTGHKVVGLKGIDPSVLQDIIEEVMAEAQNLDHQLTLTAKLLEEEGYSVVKS